MKKILSIILTLLMCSIVYAADNKVIRFGTEGTYPPFEYVDESGELRGFDIDIAKALCKEMNAECKFFNQSFNSLIPSLKLGKFDAIIASIGVTAERQKQVSFTDSYYQPSGSFVAAVDKHYTLSDVDGKTVGVQLSSTLEKYMQNKYRNKVKLKTYASIQEAFLDLVAGRVDMVLADTPVAKAWLKQNNNTQYAIVDKPIIDEEYFGTGYGIAVNKKNTELLNALNTALAKIKANGTYEKIAQQYFGK